MQPEKKESPESPVHESSTGDPIVDSLVNLREQLKTELDEGAKKNARRIAGLSNLPDSVRERIIGDQTERLEVDKSKLGELSERSIARINRMRAGQ